MQREEYTCEGVSSGYYRPRLERIIPAGVGVLSRDAGGYAGFWMRHSENTPTKHSAE